MLPRIARFLADYPDIDLVIRPSITVQDTDDRQLDLAVLVGWPPERDLIVRTLAQTRLIVCVAPDYWTRHGIPREPEDLRGHDCLIVRSSGGTLVDRWVFERDGEQRTIDVKTRVVGEDQAWLGEAAAAGVGVLRVVDLTLPRYISSGRLVPALAEWESLEAPLIFAAYPPSQRRSRLVRVSLDFLVEVFAEIEVERSRALGVARLRASGGPSGTAARMGGGRRMAGGG